MFNNVKGIFAKAFRRGDDLSSKDVAHQRLQVVLVQDRFSLPADTLEAMKNDLLEVISKYLDIDKSSIEVEVKHTAGTVVLVTNIPVAGQRGALDSTMNSIENVFERS